MNDLVSIIIPSINRKYLPLCLDSLFSQTYKNIEIIVVDDGSTDNSFELIKNKFSNKITLIKQKNLGPSAALNEGIKKAKGQFICLMGGDDISKANRVSRQMHLLEKNQADFVFSFPDLMDSCGQLMADDLFENFKNDLFTHEKILNNISLFKDLFIRGNSICAPSVLFRKSVINKIGYFNEDLIHLQDYDYWLKALSRGLIFTFSDERLIFYRRHNKNLSSHQHLENSNREKTYVLSQILENGCQDFLRKTFSDFIDYKNINPLSLSKFEKSLIMMSHPEKSLRDFGYLYFLTNSGDPSFQNASRSGFNKFKFLLET
jgi:glycosyltransferase involved in cell wall biosynthesis